MKTNTTITSVMAHVAIVLGGMYIVFYLIDRVNRAMMFIDNDLTKGLLLIMSILTITLSIRVIHLNRSIERYERQKRLREAKQRRRSTACPKKPA